MKKLFLIVLMLISFNIFSQSAKIDTTSVLSESETYFIDILNQYRQDNQLNPVFYSNKLYDWSYGQSYYIANLNKINLQKGVNSIVVGHEQDIDIPNWEEQDRNDIPVKYKFVGENVEVLFVPMSDPRKVKNQKEIAEYFLKGWINSPAHNELLLNPDVKLISVNFYKTQKFTIKEKGFSYTAYVITATMNMGNF